MTNCFVSSPNLPENRITLASVGNFPPVAEALHKEGIRTVSFMSSFSDSETAIHQDMLMCHTGENRIFLDPSQDSTVLTREGFNVTRCEALGASYPHDVRLNAAVGKDFFICNPDSLSPALLSELISSGRRPVYTKQGYTKCSVCFVTDNAVITEDISVKNALSGTSVSVLLISKGDIYLSDMHYGFFGGSTGKTDKYTLAVTGELKYHKDGEAIRSFCHHHGVKIHELVKGRITDIGGILPLCE